jgi:hypothetical protein
MEGLKFPEVLFVSHYSHSTEESPSFDAETKEIDAVDDKDPTDVAEYRLVRVRKLRKQITEVS